MDLELQTEYTTPTPKPRIRAPDVLTEILFEVSPALTYRWVEDYGKSGPMGTLNSIGHLTRYWNRVLEKAGEHQAAKSLKADMSQQTWLQTFRDCVVPVIRTNRKMLQA